MKTLLNIISIIIHTLLNLKNIKSLTLHEKIQTISISITFSFIIFSIGFLSYFTLRTIIHLFTS